ncbi:CotH kinase family protein [Streptomyces sp. 4N509B]|uniref:CotH kinase family protein n=1 Tax=Streptomyces sp. 4N509B TaxID=3457413 RepID=UPI003FD61CED
MRTRRKQKRWARQRWTAAVALLAATSLVMGGAAAGAADDPPADDRAPAPAGAAAPRQADLTGDITFSVPSGTFSEAVDVALSTTVADATIRYTTDGTPPTATSTAYDGEPLRLTATTQLRAQPFVDGAATGAMGTALYVASTAGVAQAAHDLPLLVMDAYGAGKPGREYEDVATMIMEPGADGTASVADAPAVASRAGFHLRGQSSSTFAKAPYRLELWDNEDDDADHPVLGMPADSDWVLRGPFTDKSLIREALVYDLGRAMGLAAPRYRFVEVYLNLDDQPMAAADYQGVYMIVETIKINSDRLDLAELEEEDVTPPAVTGGYVFASEWLASEEPTLPCTGPAATCWQDLEVKEPGDLQPEQLEWLTGHVQEFHDALHGETPADPDTGYPAYIDTGSFVDQVILNELSRGMDSYIRSTYFHKDREGPIVAGPLWDFDLTFGVGGYFENQETAGWQFEQTRYPVGNDWYLRLMNIPAFSEQVDARWEELRQGLLSDAALRTRVAELAAPLADAAERNFEKWPNLSSSMVGAFVTPTSETWQEQVDILEEWLTERITWLDGSGWRPDADDQAL